MSHQNPQALLIIDVQQAIDTYSDQERNNPDAELRIAALLAKWRTLKFPVFHIRHASKSKESPYHRSNQFAFKDAVAPIEGEAIITKSENCAFLGTTLEADLRSAGIQELVICGVLTNNSVDATVRVASGLGFTVTLVSDATAAFGIKALNSQFYSADDVHWLFLSNLNDEYCTVVTTDELLSSL
jgi:nicotinamidase-related amidase